MTTITAPPNWRESPMEPHTAKLQWATPGAEEQIVYMARISASPEMQSRPDAALVNYCIRKKHWSIFDMANICFGVYTTRTIGRQILRHSALKPQEFSQRYQNAAYAGDPIFSKARMQHDTNRQQSIVATDESLINWWYDAQQEVWDLAVRRYNEALKREMAKEQARDILPEGLTPTRMFFNGRIRDILTMCAVRSLSHGAQREAVSVAESVKGILKVVVPTTYTAFFEMDH